MEYRVTNKSCHSCCNMTDNRESERLGWRWRRPRFHEEIFIYPSVTTRAKCCPPPSKVIFSTNLKDPDLYFLIFHRSNVVYKVSMFISRHVSLDFFSSEKKKKKREKLVNWLDEKLRIIESRDTSRANDTIISTRI